MEKHWRIKEQGNSEDIEVLVNELGVDKVIANLLVQRGIKTYDQAKSFFRPNLDDLHDPFLMKDMDVAVERLEKALINNESILIYGDYDVDGTTSVALVYSFLRKKHSRLGYYVPDRYTEGYGISKKGIDHAIENEYTLVIALDCGIKAIENLKYAKENNIDFIVCDHHLPGDEIPEAVAILDPKREDCNYPFKELSGCGVGFKLIQAYSQRNGITMDELSTYLDLVAVSIASDIVPVIGENRVLAFYGLQQLNSNPCTGLKSIISISGASNINLTISDIVFKIGPRINAAGRIKTGSTAVELLVSGSEKKAHEIAEKINLFNTQRKELDGSITKEALETIENDQGLINSNVTVLYNPEWHKGVIGIVASRMIESYYRPTVILAKSNDIVSGSARSVVGFDLYKAIEQCSDLLENYGGHMYAAGLSMKEENVEAFRQKFEQVVNETITPDQLIPQIDVDSNLSLKDITPKFFRILDQFQPYGPQNMTPVFYTEEVVDSGFGRLVGQKGEHMKLDVREKDEKELKHPAIAFQLAKHYRYIRTLNPFKICYSVEENTFNGKTNLQLQIRDIKTN